MASEAIERYLPTLLQSEQDRIVDTVGMLTILDTGVVKEVDNLGRATVISNRIIAGRAVVYDNVEVIGLGNKAAGFFADATGCSCLILVPRSSVPDINSGIVDWNTPVYSKNGVKALPITNTYSANMRVGFTSEGTFSISTDNYLVTMDEANVKYTTEGLVLSINDDKELYLYRRTSASGPYEYKLSDQGIDSQFTSADSSLQVQQHINSIQDNNQVVLQVGMGTPTEGSETDRWGNKIPIYPNTFKIQFTQGKCIISHTDGNETTYNKIEIGTDGTLSITTPADVSVATEGNVSVQASKDATVTAKSITLTGTNGKVEIS